MKIAVLLLFSVLSCICAWAAEEDVLPTDQPLNQPVTLAVKGEALSDIMAMLSKQTGVKLRTTRDIADQKATIFVDKRPLREVITGLQTIFGYRFSAVPVGDSKVYELWESLATKRAREAATTGALGQAWQEIDKRIREVAGSSAEEQAKVKAELQRLEREKPWATRTPEETKQLKILGGKVGPGAVIAKVYAGLPPETVSALRSGCSVYFDTETSESEWKLPQDIFKDICAQAPEQIETWDGVPDGGCSVSLDFRFQGNQLLASFQATGCWTGSDGRRRVTISVGGFPGGEVTIGEVKPEGSETKLPSAADTTGVLEKQVSFTRKELADEADLYEQTETSFSILVNRSDILFLLHKKLGLQSISDHHSCWFAWDASEPQTVRHVLDSLSQMIARSDQKAVAAQRRQPGDPKSDPVWGWDGSGLLMRERFPSELDALEPPNRVIRRLRTNLAQNRYLDLDDVAEMAALTDDQAAALDRNRRRLIYVRGVDYSTTEEGNAGKRGDSAVRFYSRLTDLQKRQLRANGLWVAGLTRDQLVVLAKCVAPFLQDSQQKGQSTRSVGIWCDHMRLDKPESESSGAMPVSLVKLERCESQNYDLRVPVSQGWVGHQITASSPDDARKQLLELQPDAKNRPHFLGREMGYTMLFVLPDGTTKEHQIELFEPVEDSNEPASKSSQ